MIMFQVENELNEKLGLVTVDNVDKTYELYEEFFKRTFEENNPSNDEDLECFIEYLNDNEVNAERFSIEDDLMI